MRRLNGRGQRRLSGRQPVMKKARRRDRRTSRTGRPGLQRRADGPQSLRNSCFFDISGFRASCPERPPCRCAGLPEALEGARGRLSEHRAAAGPARPFRIRVQPRIRKIGEQSAPAHAANHPGGAVFRYFFALAASSGGEPQALAGAVKPLPAGRSEYPRPMPFRKTPACSTRRPGRTERLRPPVF